MAHKHTRIYIILPLSLLLLNAVEEIVVYKLQHYPAISKNPYLLTAVIMLLFSVGFTVVGDWLAPYIAKTIEKLHKGTKKNAGGGGILAFYLLTSALIFFLYFRIYTMGPEYILPAAWR